jgi:hypothetical protein
MSGDVVAGQAASGGVDRRKPAEHPAGGEAASGGVDRRKPAEHPAGGEAASGGVDRRKPAEDAASPHAKHSSNERCVLARSSSGTLAGNDGTVDDDLAAPDAPGLTSFQGA